MIITRVMPFPNAAVRAFTALDEDGNYNIYINDLLSMASRLKAYEHELKHIQAGDLERKGDVQDIERRAHEG